METVLLSSKQTHVLLNLHNFVRDPNCCVCRVCIKTNKKFDESCLDT